MVELKQGRWVKVHEPGQADFVKSENIMDILIGTDCLQAEATYTVRSYKKAAYWLNEYLKWAGALQDIVQYAMNDILAAADAAAREDTKIAAAGESWTCEIEKMAAGVFKVYLNWAVKEPVIENAKSKDKAAAPKRKSRKKKEESSNEISS